MKTGRLKIVHNEQVYYVFVLAGAELTPLQRKDHHTDKDSFLIYLFTGNLFKSFKLQPGKNGEWFSGNNSLLIPVEIPQIIGNFIVAGEVK